MQVKNKTGWSAMSANRRSRIVQDLFVVGITLVIFVLMAWFVSGCGSLPKPCEVLQNCNDPQVSPTPTEMWQQVTPVPSIPSPTARPTPTQTPTVNIRSITKGVIKVIIRGLFGLPLSKTSDNFALFNLVAEKEGEPLDRSLPVLEVAARGYNTSPCLIPGKCDSGDKMGLEVTYSTNLLYEDAGNFGGCGHGTNYHRRLAIGNISNEGNGSVEVEIEFDENRFKLSTPVDSVEWENPVVGSLKFSRLIQGSPWKQGVRKGQRSWLWEHLSGAPYGSSAEVVYWSGEELEVNGCP